MRDRGDEESVSPSFYCPVAGCEHPVADPRLPCEECRRVFGDMLREVGPEQPAQSAQVAVTALAARDAALRSVYAEWQEASAAVEWRANQRCWLCEERRRCRRDPMQLSRWVCRDCDERYV